MTHATSHLPINSDSNSEGFFIPLPCRILSRSDLSSTAKLAFGQLKAYGHQNNQAFPKITTLASNLGISRKSCLSAVKELREKGLIYVQRRGQGKSNVYTFPCEPIREAATRKEKVPSTTLEVPKRELLEVPKMALPYNKKERDNLNKKERSASRKVTKSVLEIPTENKLDNSSKEQHPRPSRLPEDWGLPVDWIERTHQEFGWTEERIQREAFKFRNYWCSKPGKGAYKTNWYLVWHTWCLRDWDHVRNIQQTDPKASTESFPQDQDIETCLEELKGDPVWKHIARNLAQTIGKEHFISWFEKLECQGFHDGVLSFKAPSKFIRDWINTHYHTALQQACSNHYCREIYIYVEEKGRDIC